MSTSSRKIGPLLLSGLIIGPILGSGIVLLPPIIFSLIGDYAILAWGLIQIIGFVYAYLCGQLSIIYPGDSGLAIAVENAYGIRMRKLAANFLIFAAFMGPVAVLMTAGRYFSCWFHGGEQFTVLYGVILMGLSYLILLFHVSIMSKILLFLSSMIGVLLFVGSISSVYFFRRGPLFNTAFNIKSFGYSTLLLFWSLVGWEIIGNYSMEVKDRERTVNRAVLCSTIIIAVVSLSVAAATQWVDYKRLGMDAHKQLFMTATLFPLFGNYAVPIFTILTAALCSSTFLMIVGGVARLIADQAANGALPTLLSYRSSAQTPIYGLALLFCVHTLVFTLSFVKVLDMEHIVAFANAFFICNALLGVATGVRLFKGWFLKIVSFILVIIFFILLSFSSLWVLMVVSIIILIHFYISNRPGKLSY